MFLRTPYYQKLPTVCMVWAVPFSLVTTQGISFDFFSNAT